MEYTGSIRVPVTNLSIFSFKTYKIFVFSNITFNFPNRKISLVKNAAILIPIFLVNIFSGVPDSKDEQATANIVLRGQMLTEDAMLIEHGEVSEN